VILACLMLFGMAALATGFSENSLRYRTEQGDTWTIQ
jgi:hypothetical protein